MIRRTLHVKFQCPYLAGSDMKRKYCFFNAVLSLAKLQTEAVSLLSSFQGWQTIKFNLFENILFQKSNVYHLSCQFLNIYKNNKKIK